MMTRLLKELDDNLKSPTTIEHRNLYIGRSGIDSKGYGLFCKHAITKGTLVIGFNAACLSDMTIPMVFMEENGWASDAGIYINNQFYYDIAFSKCSKWYYLNHAYPKPLLEMKKKDTKIVWIAKINIPANVELTFAYENKLIYF